MGKNCEGNWLITEVTELVSALGCAQYLCRLGLSNSGGGSLYEAAFVKRIFSSKTRGQNKGRCREDFQDQLIFLNDKEVKKTKVRFYCYFSLACILRFVLITFFF